MKLADVVHTSTAVSATSGRLEKISRLAALLSRTGRDEIPIAVGFLTGWPRQGKLGVGWATIAAARDHESAATSSLELRDVDGAFERLSSVSGRSSGKERARLLAELFARATVEELDFVGALLIGEVRQGALEGVLLEAVAKASGIPADRVRRAAMMAGDLGAVASAALGDDAVNALARYQIEVFRPVQPMLADSAPTIRDALSKGTPVVVEWKLDGARIQVHRRDDRIVVYTRNLNDVTDAVPEVVEAVSALPAGELILDGGVIALAPDGRPHSFQVTMRRFGRRLDPTPARLSAPEDWTSPALPSVRALVGDRVSTLAEVSRSGLPWPP